MLTRRTILQLPALSLVPRLVWPASQATRRALVIGINEYVPADELQAGAASSSGAQASANAKLGRGGFGSLDGAVNDALLMRQILQDRFDFLPANIAFLQDREATRNRILQEFKRHLLDEASSGDISLFYYAGHGSQVHNTGSEDADQMDETMVPVDIFDGARDIRDKEMARLYRAVAQKGIALTVILDSCHSGGMSRGVWTGASKSRYIPPDPRAVHDPPDRDPVTGAKLPDAASLGALFLFAARDDQSAGEARISEPGSRGESVQVAHGAFTAALARVLRSEAGGQSVEQICERVQAMLASEGKVQIPICAGKERASRGLLGLPAGFGATLAVPVTSVNDQGSIRLRGGSALGLAPGCTLVRTGPQPVRVELTRVTLATSEGKLLSGAPASAVQPGDVLNSTPGSRPPTAASRFISARPHPMLTPSSRWLARSTRRRRNTASRFSPKSRPRTRRLISFTGVTTPTISSINPPTEIPSASGRRRLPKNSVQRLYPPVPVAFGSFSPRLNSLRRESSLEPAPRT